MSKVRNALLFGKEYNFVLVDDEGNHFGLVIENGELRLIPTTRPEHQQQIDRPWWKFWN